MANTSKGPTAEHHIPRAERFPLKLPVSLKSGDELNWARTEDISSSGLRFQMDGGMEVGSVVDLTISLPAGMIGADDDVQVECRGRVVRNCEEAGRSAVGVVIDEYHFARSLAPESFLPAE